MPNSDSIFVRFSQHQLGASKVKATMEIRTKAVVFYEVGIQSANEIGTTFDITERIVR